MGSWNTLESDPAVFLALLRAFAPLAELDIVELWDLDISSLPPEVHSFLFLFKWRKEQTAPQQTTTTVGSTDPCTVEPVFFRQTIGNACGTIALMHILANVPSIQLDPSVAALIDFVRPLDAQSRGDLLESSDLIRSTHNSFARPEPFAHEEDDEREEDPDVYHFVAYLPHMGKLYMLDGLRAGPVELGTIPPSEDWRSQAVAHLQQRIASYAASEIRFNLLAVTPSVLHSVRREIADVRRQLDILYPLLPAGAVLAPDEIALSCGVDGVPANDAFAMSSLPDKQECSRMYRSLHSRLQELAVQVATEIARLDRYAVENARRKHNFVPFIMAAMQGLADRGQLERLYSSGKASALAARRRATRGDGE